MISDMDNASAPCQKLSVVQPWLSEEKGERNSTPTTSLSLFWYIVRPKPEEPEGGGVVVVFEGWVLVCGGGGRLVVLPDISSNSQLSKKVQNFGKPASYSYILQ